MNTKSKNSFVLLLLMALLGSYSYANAEDMGGDWTKKEQSIKGSWSVELRDDGHYLVLSDDFKTRNAPDLKFALSNQSLSQVNSKNALTAAVVIAPLKSNRGGQSYKLPDNYADFSTLLLHCEQYSKLWGASSIH